MNSDFVKTLNRVCVAFAKVLPLTVLLIFSGSVNADDLVDFDKQVKPIFENRCLECHGEKTREGGLRLTNARDAFVENDSGLVAILAGNSKQSELINRVLSHEESEQMPPEGDRLSKKEIKILKDWIDQGANWSKESTKTHWAYLPAIRPKVPALDRSGRAQNEVDHFVLRKLDSKQMTPSQPEDPARLIRRASLALTGLPPTVEQTDAFVSDPSDQAYEMFVDQCLDSPRYGERWAQPWLDLARYADSNGYQADQLRESWAYRDWVINAMNDDMPFDQFALEQLAGDLIPDATTDQKIATGFHRTVTCNVEAGVHPEQNRVNQVFDRVNTTGTVFLGTTLECCQCHNHKYDPFTQDEYYQLFAFFNNTPLEVKLNTGVQYNFVGPKMDLPLDDDKQTLFESLNKQIASAESQLKKLDQKDRVNSDALKQKLVKAAKSNVKWTELEVVQFEASSGETHEVLDDQSVLVTGSIPGTTVYNMKVESKLDRVTGFKIEALTHDSIPGKGPGRGDELRPNFILSELAVASETGEAPMLFEPVKLTNPLADYSQGNWEVAKSIDGNRKTGWAIGQEFGKPHWASYQVAEPIDQDGKTINYRFSMDQNYGRGRTIGRVRISATNADPAAFALPENIRKLLVADKLNKKEKRELDSYLDSQNPEKVKLKNELAELKKQLAAVQPPSTLVMVEMDEARDTRKLIRGEYLSPGKKVEPGVPSVLHSMSDSLPRNRLGLANWIVDADNPLFARVAVNRWWSSFFGKGLVVSEEDFGTQSDPATHPELLDWLATELIASGWSRKHIHKKIVMSATFRQTSRFTKQAVEVDPKNELYARGPRFRMPAEMIRDNGLAISGLLSTKMGGPPIMPFQPDRIWRAVGRNAPKWKAQTDENRFRRGVYVVWRRAAPYPSFVNFDAPDRAACVVKRPSTNTPLQALTLLNDKAYLEMAFALASSIIEEHPELSAEQQIKIAMRRCIARVPGQDEIKPLLELYDIERKRFSADSAAETFLKSINSAEKSKFSPEMAALTVIANVLLNLDETINY